MPWLNMQPKSSLIYLGIVAALWGLTFPLINESMKTEDPFLFVSLRFTLAALPILPYFLKRLTRSMVLGGLALGAIHLGAFLTQTIGLKSVNPSRAGFLTSIYVFIIPLITPLFGMGRPGRHDFFSALICSLGVYVLLGGDMGAMTAGDAWILAGAVLIALSIVYIGFLATRLDPYMLAYAQIVITALLSWIPTYFFADMNFAPFLRWHEGSLLFICSLLCTLLAIVWQSKHQKFVSIQSAALIFSLEPAFAAFFDSLFSQALPKMTTLIGGALILSSIFYLELMKSKLAKREAA